MNDTMKNILLWVVIALILIVVFSNFGPKDAGSSIQQMPTSSFLEKIKSKQIKKVIFDGQHIHGITNSGQQFKTYMPWNDPFLLDKMLDKNVSFNAVPPKKESFLSRFLISWLPFIVLIGIWIYLLRQMSGGKGGGGAFSFGKSKAKLMGEDQVNVTLADVAGVEEAKEEVAEIVDFLKDPDKYHRLGGKIPRGILMIGPPGTGKTLMARAIAGESKVPFFAISGSDFVEMFVGVGASRVRDMFEQAKKRSPCIIFIDEIDAVGRHRGAGMGGGHDEREQTLNQLLVEMDGFADNEGVIVIAATNRPDVLDPALLRPGRFDRQVPIGLPDVRGREQILKVHMRKLPLSKDVVPSLLARGTPGFSGADLMNLVNEGALFAARENKTKVEMNDFDRAKDKILMGAERRTMAMSEDEKNLTAYHESGHAIVGLSMPDHDPVYKVSIIPRGRALGVTMYLPEDDRVSYSRQRLESMLASLYGGRIAEELIYGSKKVTTGASNDIQRASEIARNMIKKWGLSDKLGPIMYGQNDEQPFLGQTMGRGQEQEFSGETANKIDAEVRKLIDTSYSISTKILKDNIDILHAMAEALMKYETLDAGQVKDLMDRKSVKPPEGWNDNDNKSGAKPGKAKKASTSKPKPKPKPKSSGDVDSVTR
jgi:cell division protease FtsH